MSRLKTPLRYPGGKSRATKFFFTEEHLPQGTITEYREPFLGGGSCALAFSQLYPDVPVWVNDTYYNLYCFWITLRDQCLDLQEILYAKKQEAMRNDTHRELFLHCKETIGDCEDKLEIAWRFYVCNKCSFSGLGESSGFSAAASLSNFSEAGINKLIAYSRLIQNWKITNDDYTVLLQDLSEDTFVFLDPPYDINSFLYGKKGAHHLNFDHYKFREDVIALPCHVMITYNSNQKLREMYSAWEQVEWDLTYTMHSGKAYRKDEGNRKELLLKNYLHSDQNTLQSWL